VPASELWAGVRAELPLLVGVAPFGLIYGVLAVSGGVPPLAAMAMSSIVFAGSAQFLLAGLFAEGAPALVMVATVALVNLRHLLYSASMAPFLVHLPRRWKAGLAYLLTDEAYAAVVQRYAAGDEGPHRHWFFLGAGLTLWSGWQLSCAAGIILGAQVPRSWPLDFALPVTFIAIVVPMIRSAAGATAAVVGVAVALACAGFPFKLGLVTAALTGIVAGSAVARLRAVVAREPGGGAGDAGRETGR
jgi:4-azaleucine resistance transporter AzlC